jgi:hypothetical protein
MSRIYFYKLIADNGGAPCVQDGLLSLAICKPMIRVKAQRGDLVFGFAANSLHRDNRLIYIARISENVSNGAYYREQKFASRGDCIYEWQDDHFERRKDAKYHFDKGNLTHDLGPPPDYGRANVLLSNDFRYFGGTGTAVYKCRYPLIRCAVEHLGRGQRVNLPKELHDQLKELEQQVWGDAQRRTVRKPSSDPPSDSRRDVCHRSKSCGVVES